MKSDRIYLSRSLPIVRDRSLLKIARVAVKFLKNKKNGFSKIKNPFPKLLKIHVKVGNAFPTILEILGNAFSKVGNAFSKSMEIHGNAF